MDQRLQTSTASQQLLQNGLDELMKDPHEERRTVNIHTIIVHCQVSLQKYPVVTAKLEMNLTEWIVCWQGKL